VPGQFVFSLNWIQSLWYKIFLIFFGLTNCFLAHASSAKPILLQKSTLFDPIFLWRQLCCLVL
jgi:hypothetical protein